MFEDVGYPNVITMLIAFASAVVASIMVVTAVVIVLMTLFMTHERQQRIWIRFKHLRENNRYNIAQQRRISRSPNVHPTSAKNDDDDVKLLQSYLLKRRRVNRRKEEYCDNNRINHQHQIDIVSHEVQEWKKIQKDVKMQLTVLNKAVQQLHQKNSQNKLPILEKVEH